MESVVAEVEELQRRGLLDDSATDRIQKRVQENLRRMDQEHKERISFLQARHAPKAHVLPFTKRLPFLVLLVFVLGSIPLHMTVGGGFIFSYASEFKALLPWLTGFLAFLVGFWIFRDRKWSEILAEKAPNIWGRWFLAIPVIAGTISFAIAVAPLGWLALYAWGFGVKSAPQRATVISIEQFHASRGCSQKAKLAIDGEQAEICVAWRLSGAAPKAGETVMVSGKISPLGLYVSDVCRETSEIR
jgi:hypothetical protein